MNSVKDDPMVLHWDSRDPDFMGDVWVVYRNTTQIGSVEHACDKVSPLRSMDEGAPDCRIERNKVGTYFTCTLCSNTFSTVHVLGREGL